MKLMFPASPKISLRGSGSKAPRNRCSSFFFASRPYMPWMNVLLPWYSWSKPCASTKIRMIFSVGMTVFLMRGRRCCRRLEQPVAGLQYLAGQERKQEKAIAAPMQATTPHHLFQVRARLFGLVIIPQEFFGQQCVISTFLDVRYVLVFDDAEQLSAFIGGDELVLNSARLDAVKGARPPFFIDSHRPGVEPHFDQRFGKVESLAVFNDGEPEQVIFETVGMYIVTAFFEHDVFAVAYARMNERADLFFDELDLFIGEARRPVGKYEVAIAVDVIHRGANNDMAGVGLHEPELFFQALGIADIVCI